jgi:hypothetical protein
MTWDDTEDRRTPWGSVFVEHREGFERWNRSMTARTTAPYVDGWFRVDDVAPVPESGPLDGPPEPAAMAAWLRAHGHYDGPVGHWDFGGAVTDEAPEWLRSQGFRLDPWQHGMLYAAYQVHDPRGGFRVSRC